MKVEVLIKQLVAHHGIIEMTNDEYTKYKEMKERDTITKLLLKGTKRNRSCDEWSLEVLEEYEEPQ
jgi:hypothetical protein